MAAACDTTDQSRLRNWKGGFSRGLDDDEEVGLYCYETFLRRVESGVLVLVWIFVRKAFLSFDAATLRVDPVLIDSTGRLSHGEHQHPRGTRRR